MNLSYFKLCFLICIHSTGFSGFDFFLTFYFHHAHSSRIVHVPLLEASPATSVLKLHTYVTVWSRASAVVPQDFQSTSSPSQAPTPSLAP